MKRKKNRIHKIKQNYQDQRAPKHCHGDRDGGTHIHRVWDPLPRPIPPAASSPPPFDNHADGSRGRGRGRVRDHSDDEQEQEIDGQAKHRIQNGELPRGQSWNWAPQSAKVL